MAEMSLETEAILNRLKKEGDLIRNSGKNSIKQVNINLDKLHTTFKAINAAMLNNTAVIKQASDIENKIRKEEAERARRQGEIDELTQKDKAKAAELRAKADALRAKEELRDAKGPGLFAKFKESDTKKLLKNAAIIGGIGFIAGNIALGALDKKFESEGGFVKAMEARGNQFLDDAAKRLKLDISDGIKDGITRGIRDGLNDPEILKVRETIDSILNPNFWVKTVIGLIGTTTIISAIGGLFGGLGKFFKQGGPYDRGKNRLSVWRQGSNEPTPKATPKATPRVPGGPAMQPQMFDEFGDVTKAARRPLGERLRGQANRAIDRGMSTALSPKNVGTKVIPGLSVGLTAYDVLYGGTSPDQLSDLSLANFLESGEFEKDRTTLTDIAAETAATAAVSAGVSAAVTAWTGPGAGAAALGGGITGGLFGLASGTAKMIRDIYKDAGVLGMDAIPNDVEEALKRELELMESKGISPKGLRDKLETTADKIQQTRELLEGNLQALVDEATPIQEELDALKEETGGNQRQKNQRQRRIRELESKLKDIREGAAPLRNQLDNTIKLQEMSNQRRNQFLESIGQQPIAMLDNTGAAERLASLASAGGGSFVNTQVINNTYNNQFVQNSRNNWNSGQVVVENMTGGSGEQVALG